jgi:hypothetical protein
MTFEHSNLTSRMVEKKMEAPIEDSDSDENPETLGPNEEIQDSEEVSISTPAITTLTKIEDALSLLQRLESSLNAGLNFNPFAQAISDLKQVHTFHSFVLVRLFFLFETSKTI